MSYYFLLDDCYSKIETWDKVPRLNSIARIRFYNNQLIAINAPVSYDKDQLVDQWLEQGYLKYDTLGYLIKGKEPLPFSVMTSNYTIEVTGTAGTMLCDVTIPKNEIELLQLYCLQLGLELKLVK
jgi:hypothetical protein